MVVLSSPSRANEVGIERKLKFVILIADRLGKDNIVHYGSSRCHRVTCSVMAAEVHTLVHAFDHWYVICKSLEKLKKRRFEIGAFADSRILLTPSERTVS